jgi:hypothetical protein
MLRRPSRLRAALLCIVLAAAGGTASAQTGASLNRAGSGARAAGMGDAFVAVSDDGTAASWNPAGLAQLRQPEFSLVYMVNDRAQALSALRSPDGRMAYSAHRFQYSNKSIDFASAAIPFSVARKPVTFQVGWHRLYQLGTDLSRKVDRYVIDEPGTPVTRVTTDDRTIGDIDVLSLAGAMKLTSRTALGGSLDVWRGQWKERYTIFDEPGREGAPSFISNDSRQRLRGHNFTVGLLLTFPTWNAGLVYHSPFWSSLRVHVELRSTVRPPEDLDGPNVRFRLPRSLGAGLARKLGPRWTVAAALTHDQWTNALLTGLPDASGPVNFFDGAPPDLTTTRDTVSLNAGVEHLVLLEGSVVPLRLGFGVEPQGGMDPVTRDPIDFFLVSGGAGYNTNRFKIDAAVQFRWTTFQMSDVLSVDTALADGLQRDALARSANHEWRIKLSAIYRIQDVDKLRGILRRIFG